MFEKKKPINKKVYNNYQFYETAALNKFLENQAKEGYYLSGTIGFLFTILKFHYEKNASSLSYIIYRKHFDKQIDEEVERLRAAKNKIVSENNYIILFGINSNKASELKSEKIENIQNTLLGIPKKKSIVLILAFSIISVISFILKILMLKNGALYFNQISLILYTALIINFLIYFIGDIHDFLAGKGIQINNVIFFSNRTKFKDILFRLGDILKFTILLGSIFTSAAILLIEKDPIVIVNVVKMWLIYFIIGYAYRLRFQKSYISLLIIEAFLSALSF